MGVVIRAVLVVATVDPRPSTRPQLIPPRHPLKPAYRTRIPIIWVGPPQVAVFTPPQLLLEMHGRVM